MTLPEVIISVLVMGIISATVASAVIVSLRQADSTEGRVNVARAEQSVGTWLPADLASTDVSRTDLPAVDTNPGATPCGSCGSIDLSGSNALQLAWSTMVGTPPTEVITRVQYQYIQVGNEWQLQRIMCEGALPCTMRTVLHDLEPPADPATYDPETESPTWIMDVAAPEIPEGLDLSDNARRVRVTVNGGGESDGRGGGQNTISLTAGGESTYEIDADDFTVPSFVRARSRCGGPVALIVDDSGSVGSAVTSVVEPGVEAFIESFRGTPTQVQVVSFSYYSNAFGAGSNWHNYVDMTDDAAVDALKSSVAPTLDSYGGTNWEDAFFRVLRNSDGTPASTVPNRIVFFTDGQPTMNRLTPYSSGRGTPPSPFGNSSYYRTGNLWHPNAGPYDFSAGWTQANRSDFNQESFDRTDAMLDDFRHIDLIFVGVGSGLNDSHRWIQNQTAYENPSAPPAYRQFKTGVWLVEELLTDGAHDATPAVYSGGEYTNPETADLYIQSSFDSNAFAAAMKAAALKDCGGTLTIQTRLTDGSSVPAEFVYENLEYRDDTGAVVDAEARRVTTSSAFRTGTFDFEIPSGVDYFSVDVVPQELQTLSSYNFVGWSCRAGADAKSTTSIAIPDSSWEGFTVDVNANEAVSCILEVST